MKILWLVNIVMPELAEHLNGSPSVFGGWLSGALQAVRASGNELAVVVNKERTKQSGRYDVNGVRYYITAGTDDASMRAAFREILSAEQPDVVHLYGTEFPQAWAMAQEFDPEKTLVSIQGLVHYYAEHVYGGVPEPLCRDRLLHKLLRRLKKGGTSIELQRKNYLARADSEVRTLERVRWVNGGTAWGDGCARLIQPDVRLLNCGLILRDSFYGPERWSYDACEKHSIFTIYTYPIKGFDMVLKALRLVIRQYPDTKVYVAGNRCAYRSYTGIKRKLMDHAPDYDWYVQGLIEEYGLKEHLVFLGFLSEQQMREQHLKANVFVSASSIENHSTILGEAMISGVPSVASCVGGLQEMIDHGEDGFLYPFNEPYMMAYYICRLFEDPELARQFSAKGQAHAGRTYDRETNARKLIEMYQTINNTTKEAHP